MLHLFPKIEPEPAAYKGEVLPGAHEHHEIDAPVKFNNPKIVQQVQTFIDMYGRPKYDEIDPTMLFAIVFPLFYGFILGDIGYGLLIVIIALFMKQKMKYNEGWQILINLFTVCAVSSIFFGILFGEFFGFSIAEPIVNGQEVSSEWSH